MEHSPIRTIVKNLTDVRRSLRIERDVYVVVSPKGTSGDTVTVIGDIFSRCSSSDMEYSILSALRHKEIELSYVVDHLFPVKEERNNPQLSCNDPVIRNWYFKEFSAGTVEEKPVAKPAATPKKKVEEPKVEEPAAVVTEKPAEVPAQVVEEPKTVVEEKPVVVEEKPAKAAPVVEEPKADATAKTETAKTEPVKKAGRRIKVD